MTHVIQVNWSVEELFSVTPSTRVSSTMTDRRICRKATEAIKQMIDTKKKEVSRIPNENAIVYRNWTWISGLF